MKSHPNGGRRLKFATGGQRALTMLLLLLFVGLILAARSGRYDREVNRMAGWLESGYDRVVGFTRDTFRKH